MKEPILIRNARFILTLGEEGSVLEYADVRMEGASIEGVGRNLKKQRGDEVIDASGCVVMPGLINSHTHSSMIALRGLNDDAPLEDWLQSMWDVEDRLTGDLARIASEAAIIEMISTGTAGCIDMYEAFEASRAARKTGIRMANGPALISRFSDASTRLNETERFIEEYRNDPLIRPVINLHSIYTNDPETIEKAAQLSDKERVPLHVHCSETRKEVFDNRRERGRLALDELDHLGALTERTILVHLGWAASWELSKAANVGASAVHCPSSNMKLGTGGFFPFRELKKMGVRIGLGTDSASSNNSLDMFREMRMMALVQKGQYWDPTASLASDALYSGSRGGYDILGLKGGQLSEGYLADLIIIDPDASMGPLRKENLNSAIVYSATGDKVCCNIVNGEVVYRGGTLRDGDPASEVYGSVMDELNASLFR